MFLMSEIDVGDTYVEAILPAVVVFGLGLSLVVAPVTITVLAAADPRQAGRRVRGEQRSRADRPACSPSPSCR